MVELEASVDIDRPIDEVFAYVADPAKTPEWSSVALECSLEGSGPIGVGSRIRSVGQFIGRRVEASEEVTQYAPPHKMVVREVTGPTHGEKVRQFESIGEGTRYRVRIAGESGGLFKLADPIVAALMKRTIETDLQTLKALLEAKVAAGA